MNNCKPNDGIFEQKWYSKGLISDFKEHHISVLVGALNYIINKANFPFMSELYTTPDHWNRGRPQLNYQGVIKAYFLLVWRGLSLRDLTRVATPGSEYLYLLGSDNVIPKKSSLTNIGQFIDCHIDKIFDEINSEIEKEIGSDKTSLYCDGTIFEAHNSRNKVITRVNVKKGVERWEKKIKQENISEADYDIATLKLEKWHSRAEILNNLDRNSYGLTDFDCILVQDKNKAYIAGYNVQLVEEAKHGLVVYAHISNKTPDVNAFREMINDIIEKYQPEYFTVDAGYDAPDILEKMHQNNIRLVVKTRKDSHSQESINELNFELNEAEDALVCPNKKELVIVLKRNKNNTKDSKRFVCKECQGCTYIEQCKPVNGVKSLVINMNHYKKLKAAKGFVLTKEGKEIYEHRGNICESPNGFIKYYLKGKKLKRNGLKANNTTIKILVLGYNLTRFYNIKTNM